MKKCKLCGNINYSTLIVHTETAFGHGESMHKCYVKCHNCNNVSESVSDWNLFNETTFRKAIDIWDKENSL